ncbi:superinfection immunity protein [Pelagibacterium nitratireducens]|uniref:Superinfection immunity protein n=1 Tax=Pelagibacterium nitratireducens TaxID=1046114 RepID=A0ABZ2I1R5_9HYPH
MFISPAMAQSAGGTSGIDMLLGFGAFGIVLILISLIIYFIPTFIAFRRKHPNKWIIFLINFLLGATFIGWIVALIWSLLAIHITSEGKIINETKSAKAE